MTVVLIINIHTGIVHGAFTTQEKADNYLSKISGRGSFSTQKIDVL